MGESGKGEERKRRGRGEKFLFEFGRKLPPGAEGG